MIKKIVTDLGVLRKQCERCPPGMRARIAADLVDTLEASIIPGVGIAAPQIGYPYRVVAVRTGSDMEIMVNPIVLRRFGSGGSIMEGCLSRPGLSVMVYRKLKVRVSYEGLNGAPVVRTFRGFTARVVQHELDHLEGIVIGDKK